MWRDGTVACRLAERLARSTPGVEPVTLDWEAEAMWLRIFPRDESFFDLFEAAADNMVQSARLLDDLLGDFVDPELKAKRLVEVEREGDRITHAILTRLSSSFITPFDREDIYALAAQLDDVVDAVEEAADMLVLHKVAEPIEPVREQPGSSSRLPRRPPAGCASSTRGGCGPIRWR